MGLLGSAAATFLPWLQVSDPACTCWSCFLVPHTVGLPNEQAAGEVAHGQGRHHHCSVHIPGSMEGEGGSSFCFLRHSAGVSVPQFPAVVISGLLSTSC